MTSKRKPKPHPASAATARRASNRVSANKVLERLHEAGYPVSMESLVRRLNVDKLQIKSLERIIDKLVRSVRIINLGAGYAPIDRSRLIVGTLKVQRSGAGCITPDKPGGIEAYVGEEFMKGYLPGDRVTGYLTSKGVGSSKTEARIVRVESRCDQVLGTLCQAGGRLTVRPLSAEGSPIVLRTAPPAGVAEGSIVWAQITERSAGEPCELSGEIASVVGGANEPGILGKVALLRHGLEDGFCDKVLQAAQELTQAQPSRHRKDLQHLPFFTIDDESAMDLDDALAGVRRPDGGADIYVAIADVAEIIKPGSLLDKMACERGQSVYLPGHSISMFPRAVGRAASLLPGAPRAALVAHFCLDKDGMVQDIGFLDAWIHSRAKLSYQEVDGLMASGAVPSFPVAAARSLDCVAKFFHAVSSKSLAEIADTSDELEVDARVIKPGLERRMSPSRRLVQGWMIATNQAVADFLEDREAVAVYRTQDAPHEFARRIVDKALRAEGLEPLEHWDAPELRRLFSRIERNAQLANLIRAQLPAATYAIIPGKHTTLAKESYAHATSPIRRYSDLVNQRVLKAIIRGNKLPALDPSIAVHLTERAQRAQTIEKEVERAQLSRDVLAAKGQILAGYIKSVSRFGCFVRLNDFAGAEGLVHIATLPKSYRFDETGAALVGTSRQERYQAGCAVRVRARSVCPWEGRIELEMATV